MKKYSLLLIAFFPIIMEAQPLLIDKTNTDYSFNEKTFEISNKVCHTVNVICTSDSLLSENRVKPLVFFKIFDFGDKRVTIKKPLRYLKLEDYIKNDVVVKLKWDLQLYVTTLGNVSHTPNISVIDSLIIYDGKDYMIMSGVVEINFYNLLDFKQTHIQQCNQTILNTMAMIAPLYRNERNGEMNVDIDSTGQMDLYGKLYLIKKKDDLYTFRWVQLDHDEHSPFDYYSREFVYKKDYGIISFRSPYFFRRTGEFKTEKIGATNEYYYFK
jgi:hypothetical protein